MYRIDWYEFTSLRM